MIILEIWCSRTLLTMGRIEIGLYLISRRRHLICCRNWDDSRDFPVVSRATLISLVRQGAMFIAVCFSILADIPSIPVDLETSSLSILLSNQD